MSDEEENNLPMSDESAAALRDLIHRLAIADPLLEEFTVKFSGGGDSGSVESVDAEPGHDAAQKILDEDDVNDTMNEILTNAGYDWWNNDGGQGTMTINIKTRVVDVDMQLNITTSESHPLRATI